MRYWILQLRMHFVHLSVIVGLSQLRHYPDKCMGRSESGSVRQMPTVPQPFFWRASLAASSAVGFYSPDIAGTKIAPPLEVETQFQWQLI